MEYDNIMPRKEQPWWQKIPMPDNSPDRYYKTWNEPKFPKGFEPQPDPNYVPWTPNHPKPGSGAMELPVEKEKPSVDITSKLMLEPMRQVLKIN